MEGERPTTATLDRRVERLEAAQAETDRKVDQALMKMEYMGDLMALKFSAIEASQSSQATKLDAFMAKIDNLINEGLRQASDLRSMPLGRQVDDRLVALEERAEEQDKANGFGPIVRQYVLPILAVGVAVASFVVPH